MDESEIVRILKQSVPIDEAFREELLGRCLAVLGEDDEAERVDGGATAEVRGANQVVACSHEEAELDDDVLDMLSAAGNASARELGDFSSGKGGSWT